MPPFRRRPLPLLALAATAGALVAAPAASAFRAPSQSPARPALDVRAGDRAPVAPAVADARATLAHRLGDQGTVAVDRETGGVRLVARTDRLLTGASESDPATVALDYVRAHRDAFGLADADLAQLHLAHRETSPDGVTHLTWSQAINGVPAYDSALTASVTRDGRLVNVGGAPVADLAVPSVDPPLGPAAARSAAQRDLGVTPDGDTGTIGAGAQRPTTFANGDAAHLVVVAGPTEDRLAWRLTVAGTNPYVYDVLVDAASGDILARHSRTSFAFQANALEDHPGAAGPAEAGTARAVDLTPYFVNGSSPTTLNGVYAHAYADVNDNNTANAGEDVAPSSGTDFLYSTSSVAPASGQHCPTAFSTPCTWDGSSRASAAANQAEATTQLFWFVNRYHDWLAQAPIGFTSSSYNFEGADAVQAQADDGGGLNNANMSTPPDGLAPQMQMYLFGSPFPAVDGDFDATVVYHEYTHGLSNRLVGGDGQADGLYARQSEAMGEGWSDFYALDYLVAEGLEPDTSAPGEVVVGAYVTDDQREGIRYNALDCPVGYSGSTCLGSGSAGAGGFTFADMGRVTDSGDSDHPYFEVHADGEIWSETLWDLRTALGATTARGLITEGMRLSPKDPSFLDMRDAILEADLVAGGAHHAQIWSVFAARGMGYGATTTSANATRGIASFATPTLAEAGTASVSSPAPLGDGDRSLEPGEAARVSIGLTNPGTAALTNVRATLTTSTDGVFVGQPSASYGTIAPGDTAAADQPFAITVPASVPCGTLLALTLSVTSDQGSFDVPVTVGLESGRGTTSRTYGSPLSIPDGQPAGGITSTLSVASAARIDRLRVQLGINHTYMGDLHVWLRSPAGTVVDLMEEPGLNWGSPTNLSAATPLTFDDEATASIQDVSGGTSSTTSGTFEPDEPLSHFAGENRAGIWTLRITDDYASDSGTLSSWSIETDDPTCAATGPALPKPTTDPATGVTSDAATINGHLDPLAAETTAALEYGTTTAYGTRTAQQTFVAGPDSPAVHAALTGLTPSTTYHVRALAFRDGVLVTAGADQTFTTASTPPPPVPPTTTSTTGSQLTTTTTTTTTPPVEPPHTSISVFSLPRTAWADRRGRVTLLFGASPALAHGTLALLPARGPRALGTAKFTVPQNGRVRARLTLSPSARRALRRTHRLRVRVRVVVEGRAFAKTMVLKLRP